MSEEKDYFVHESAYVDQPCRIGKGTKIDNLVQVAHNVKIGKNVMIAGQCGIAGSSTIGDNTMMGGGAGISDHVTIGKNVKVGAILAIFAKGQSYQSKPSVSVRLVIV